LRIDNWGVGVTVMWVRKLAIPWEQVTGLVVEGPEQAESRFTATRLALIGPFALAFKKKGPTPTRGPAEIA
jgi:hypothetical protein